MYVHVPVSIHVVGWCVHEHIFEYMSNSMWIRAMLWSICGPETHQADAEPLMLNTPSSHVDGHML